MGKEAILTYISSSEFNRCKKNGLSLFEPRMLWIEVLSYTWLTRKLRRKLGHLFQMGLLPEIKAQYVAGVGMENPDLFKMLSKHMAASYLKAEDDFIMKGMGK